jgi:hypothetical protein
VLWDDRVDVSLYLRHCLGADPKGNLCHPTSIPPRW